MTSTFISARSSTDIARLRVADDERACRRRSFTTTLLKKFTRRGHVARAQPVLRQLDHELVVGVLKESVAALLVRRLAVLPLDERPRRSTR